MKKLKYAHADTQYNFAVEKRIRAAAFKTQDVRNVTLLPNALSAPGYRAVEDSVPVCPA